MIRATILSVAVATGFALPAVAADEANTADAYSVQAFTNKLAAVANQKEIRDLLASRGYIVTSDLNRDDSGHWIGQAMKDGKVVGVAVKMPPRQAPTTLTN